MPPIGNAMSLAVLDNVHQGTAMPSITDLYVGLLTVTGLSTSQGTWAASTAVTSGTTTIYVVVGGVTYIFKSGGTFTGGTTGTTNPFSSLTTVTEGQVVSDNGGTWTEQTIAIRGGTFSEASGGGYARQAIANTSTNFGITTDANNRAQVKNLNLITYGTVTAALGWVVGAIYFIASTGTSVWEWITFTTPVYVVVNSTPQIPANGDTLAIG